MQVVARDARLDVVDVVQADAAGEPLQHLRQLVVGTSLQRRSHRVPRLVMCPVHVLVLVLHVEQPHANRTGEESGGQLHPQQRRQPDRQVCDHERRNDARVGEVHAEPFAFAGAGAEHTIAEHEQDRRANAEHDERVAEHAIEEPLRPRRCQVLVGRQRPHIADAPAVQVAGSRVMLGVRLLPLVERRQGEQPGDVSHDPVRATRRKEGAVAAIVEDDEQPHQERRGRDDTARATTRWPRRTAITITTFSTA